MKTQQKSEGVTVAAISTDSSPALTIFDQMVVIHSALSKEVGIAPSELLPKPKIEIPEWCGNVVKQLGKTILKPISKLRPKGKVDWRNYGRTLTIMERYKTFLKHDVPRILEEEIGNISDERWKGIEAQLGVDEMRACLIKGINRPVADDEPLERLFDEAFARQFENLERHRQVALYHVAQQGAKESALFYKGMAEGYELFIDERADFCGNRGRANIYLELLSCMLDVEKLRRTLPPTTRAQYFNKLAKVFKLPIDGYDWFQDVCDDVKFPLNNLGRKRRSSALIL